MVGELQQVIAVWTVLVLPFVLIAAFLQVNSELTVQFVAFYWFPAVVLTLLGVLPAPWRALQALPG
jgi:hypothetical protein